MQMKIIPIKRALLSVSNKEGLIEFAQGLTELGIDIISTGGTSLCLTAAHIPHQKVESIIEFPEMLDGRVKTLHPRLHGGILGRRDQHAEEAQKHGIKWIDLVVVNFYPFAEVLKKESIAWDEVIEQIDVGGPTMVRAAAKNFNWVTVVTDQADYKNILSALQNQQGTDFAMRKKLAQKAFALTSQYDAMIHRYFVEHEQGESDKLTLEFNNQFELRYGENPHQKALAYQAANKTGLLSAKQYQGKPLSYNNLLDADAAWTCVREFSSPACVIVKHANPCGAAIADSIGAAYKKAYEADPVSAFGGIIALNRPCTAEIAQAITEIFMEVVLAPSYSDEALTILQAKPNLRVLEIAIEMHESWEMKFITGGLLMQERDNQVLTRDDLQIVTECKPHEEDLQAMLFAWQVLKHVKSNGILIAKESRTVGVGAGQVSRIDAVDLAVRKAGVHIQDAVLASDAFFPFRDSIDRLAETGVRAIIQPGGSMRDEEVIAACNQHGIAMVFTGKRCFKH